MSTGDNPVGEVTFLSIVWLVLGFGFLLYLARRARGGLRDAGRLFGQASDGD